MVKHLCLENYQAAANESSWKLLHSKSEKILEEEANEFQSRSLS